MSLILDALRKLDRERSLRHRTMDIATEVVRPDPTVPETKRSSHIVTFLVAAAVGACLTYGVLSRKGPTERAAPGSVLQGGGPPVAQLGQPPSGTHQDEIMRREAKTPAPVEKRPLEIKGTVEGKKPSGGKKELPMVEPRPYPAEERSTSEVLPRERPVASEELRQPVEGPAPPTLLDRESLKLSGIVWSEDPSRRLAVINGIVTREGDTFGGMRVIEIHPELVRILLHDQRIELSLSK